MPGHCDDTQCLTIPPSHKACNPRNYCLHLGRRSINICVTSHHAPSSLDRNIAGEVGFLILSQVFEGPDWYGISRRFDTMPSSPSLHPCSKITAPSPRLVRRIECRASRPATLKHGASVFQVAGAGNPPFNSRREDEQEDAIIQSLRVQLFEVRQAIRTAVHPSPSIVTDLTRSLRIASPMRDIFASSRNRAP